MLVLLLLSVGLSLQPAAPDTSRFLAEGENRYFILKPGYQLRLLGKASGKQVVPKDLSRFLNITSASTTSLIDRLVASGHVRREAHPTDRRSVVVIASVESDKEVRETLGAMHRRMMSVAESLTAEEARVVVAFLQRMTQALAARDVDEAHVRLVRHAQWRIRDHHNR